MNIMKPLFWFMTDWLFFSSPALAIANLQTLSVYHDLDRKKVKGGKPKSFWFLLDEAVFFLFVLMGFTVSRMYWQTG